MNQTPSEKIRFFLARHFDPSEISDTDDFIDRGLVSSLLLLELLDFVRQEFSIALPIMEINLQDFRTVGSIVEVIERKK